MHYRVIGWQIGSFQPSRCFTARPYVDGRCADPRSRVTLHRCAIFVGRNAGYMTAVDIRVLWRCDKRGSLPDERDVDLLRPLNPTNREGMRNEHHGCARIHRRNITPRDERALPVCDESKRQQRGTRDHRPNTCRWRGHRLRGRADIRILGMLALVHRRLLGTCRARSDPRMFGTLRNGMRLVTARSTSGRAGVSGRR